MTSGSSRREFLRSATAAGIGAGALSLVAKRAFAQQTRASGLRVLVLGGTGQTGPHFIECALAQGHTVTMLNRGNRSEDLFPEVECIIGDRDPAKADGLDALRKEIEGGRKWEVAVDIWPHIPKMVENTANLVKPAVGHYMYVSSVSVYTDSARPNQDETGPVGEAPDADNLEYTNERFGPFKAECENRVRRIFPDAHTIFRPGLIVGPRDGSHRGVYWPRRVREGGDVVAPPAEDPVQLIDGRDLVAFEVLCMERGIMGTFNVLGPHPRRPMTMGSYLAMCKEVSRSDATILHMTAEFLDEQGVAPWTMLPCWLPAGGDSAGFGNRSIEKAVAAGLTFRPMTETIRDTYTWWDGLDDAARARSLGRGFGVPKEKEAEVVAAWREREQG